MAFFPAGQSKASSAVTITKQTDANYSLQTGESNARVSDNLCILCLDAKVTTPDTSGWHTIATLSVSAVQAMLTSLTTVDSTSKSGLSVYISGNTVQVAGGMAGEYRGIIPFFVG